MAIVQDFQSPPPSSSSHQHQLATTTLQVGGSLHTTNQTSGGQWLTAEVHPFKNAGSPPSSRINSTWAVSDATIIASHFPWMGLALSLGHSMYTTDAPLPESCQYEEDIGPYRAQTPSVLPRDCKPDGWKSARNYECIQSVSQRRFTGCEVVLNRATPRTYAPSTPPPKPKVSEAAPVSGYASLHRAGQSHHHDRLASPPFPQIAVLRDCVEELDKDWVAHPSSSSLPASRLGALCQCPLPLYTEARHIPTTQLLIVGMVLKRNALCLSVQSSVYKPEVDDIRPHKALEKKPPVSADTVTPVRGGSCLSLSGAHDCPHAHRPYLATGSPKIVTHFKVSLINQSKSKFDPSKGHSLDWTILPGFLTLIVSRPNPWMCDDEVPSVLMPNDNPDDAYP
ncbi:uncharacterized protein CLUP02_08779 [Colletotrichum lupini]|uniref:Uncharacterized protein n=1 Tax=Colletotrichum lupini TaxID=145971 RepID=A0A9Q8WHY5_9PEZI|nr:uncharacterized protein CLUP02_08779 [Colletotrichum lupini]UQC83285.1 hypothetical protein CLUP02_08779 [Colletotrichum lupini]